MLFINYIMPLTIFVIRSKYVISKNNVLFNLCYNYFIFHMFSSLSLINGIFNGCKKIATAVGISGLINVVATVPCLSTITSVQHCVIRHFVKSVNWTE